MSVNKFTKGAIGVRFDFGSGGFDMVANTTLEAVFVKPGGALDTKTATLNGTTVGNFEANESAFYRTVDGDLDTIGTWEMYLHYVDATFNVNSFRATFQVVA